MPHYNVPLACKTRLIVTVHDLIHLKFPPSRAAYFYARTMFHAVCKKAHRIIADSQNTRKDLLEIIGADDRKIRVIYPGMNRDFVPGYIGDNAPRTDDFLLYIGILKPTKNIALLLQSFTAARKKLPEMKLVVAGRNFMPSLTAQYGPDSGVQFAGELSLRELGRLYRNTRAFVFPSLYEGFGLPPLEAMSCGAPVICSNAASLPEVVGDAAITVTPTDGPALTGAITQIWENSALRETLRLKGYERVKLFTWEKCAEKVAKCYLE